MTAIEGPRRHPYVLVAFLAAIVWLITPSVGLSANACGEALKSYTLDSTGNAPLPDDKSVDHTLKALGCHTSIFLAANQTLNSTYELKRRKLAVGFHRKLDLNDRTAVRFAVMTKKSATSRWFRWPVRIAGAFSAILIIDDVRNLARLVFGTSSDSPSISAAAIEERMRT